MSDINFSSAAAIEPAPVHPIDAAVQRSMVGVRTNGILFAVFLGGVGANWVYLSPKKTGPVIIMLVSLLVGMCTFGIPNLILWLVAVISACSKGSTAAYEADVRAKAEAEYAVRQQIGA